MNKLIVASIFLITAICLRPLTGSAQNKDGHYKVLCIQVLKLVNDHRASMGLPSLLMNDVVSPAAERHSRNMAAQNIPFGHDGFDNRMASITRKLPANGWAENVAYGSDDAHEIVDMWLHSPGHKKNIEGDYNTTGIGIALGKNGSYYYTQIFIKKRK